METNVTEPTALRCESCGRIRKRLFSAPHTVKSLSLGHEVREGDLICERCLMELQEELTDEEMSRGPA
jgi:hypothetical protein